MSKRFRVGKRGQGLLFGTRIDERLDENHEVYAFERLIERLNIDSFRSAYNLRGGACYDPADMIKILFYGYHCGIRSSRKLARACQESLPFIYLAGDLRIKFRAVAEFRVRFEAELKELFVQVVHLGFDLKLITGETAFQDGTKIRSSTSNAGFKPRKEWKEILAAIEEELKDHFDSSRKTDEAEDDMFGPDHPGEGFTSNSREEMYACIEEAVAKAKQEKAKQKRKEAEHREEGIDKGVEEKDTEPEDAAIPESKFDAETLEKMAKALSIHKALEASEEEADTVKINPVDPDSRFIKSKEGTNSNYNAQIVTEKSFIVAVDVSNEAADQNQLIDLVNQRLKNLPVKPESYFADAGYFAGANLKHLSEEGITAYIPERSWNEANDTDGGAFAPRYFKHDPVNDTMECPKGKRLERTGTAKEAVYRCTPEHCVRCGFRSQCLLTKEDQRRGYRSIKRDDYSKYRDEQRLRMESEVGRKAYRQRSADVEPVFGNLKANRGFRHFLVRGKDKVLQEFLWMAGAHNLAWIMRRLPVPES